MPVAHTKIWIHDLAIWLQFLQAVNQAPIQDVSILQPYLAQDVHGIIQVVALLYKSPAKSLCEACFLLRQDLPAGLRRRLRDLSVVSSFVPSRPYPCHEA